jgi:hypothetical protein
LFEKGKFTGDDLDWFAKQLEGEDGVGEAQACSEQLHTWGDLSGHKALRWLGNKT